MDEAGIPQINCARKHPFIGHSARFLRKGNSQPTVRNECPHDRFIAESSAEGETTAESCATRLLCLRRSQENELKYKITCFVVASFARLRAG
jgi:hypothetical protein